MSQRSIIREVDRLRVAAIDALPQEIPPYVQAFLTRKIRKEITVKEAGSLAHDVPVLFAICGYKDAVRYFCESFVVRCTDPEYRNSDTGTRGSWPHLQWCAQRVGLTGYAELFNITRNLSPGAIPRIKRFALEDSVLKYEGYGPPENPGIMWQRTPDISIQNYAKEMGMIMFLRLSPGENDLGWDRADCDRQLEALSANLRQHIGLPAQLENLGEPDPVVTIPEGFTSIYDPTNPDFTPAGGYTPPTPTVYHTPNQPTTHTKITENHL
ncbi:MAG: hypothetical protein Q4C81_08835 [Kocuria sp.]|nr:hypothetical protein [Kocuria sp.]